jgi:hypothetical protein
LRRTRSSDKMSSNGFLNHIENYPCCAFLCKRAFHNMTLAQKSAAGIIFDITDQKYKSGIFSVSTVDRLLSFVTGKIGLQRILHLAPPLMSNYTFFKPAFFQDHFRIPWGLCKKILLQSYKHFILKKFDFETLFPITGIWTDQVDWLQLYYLVWL